MNILKAGFISLLAVLSSCTSVFYQPDRFLYYPPTEFKLDFENIYFHSHDNTKLHGWYIRNNVNKEQPKGLIVHFHGNAQNMSSHYLNLAWVTKFGYDLFVFDYRGYGTSEGNPDKDGVYFDSLSALNEAYQLKEKNKAKSFVVYGQSLGGALASRALYDFHHKNKVDLLVLDSTFMNYKQVASQVMRNHWLTWSFSPLAYLLISNEYSTENIIPKISNKTLVIHGKDDHIVWFENGEKIFNTLTAADKTFWPIDQGKHIDIFTRKDDKNRSRFIEVLNNLRN